MTQAAYHIKIRNHLLGPAAISSDFQQLFESTGKYRAHNVESKMHHASRMTIIWINRVTRHDGEKMTKTEWTEVNRLMNQWASSVSFADDIRIATSAHVLRLFGAIRETFKHGYHGSADRWVTKEGRPSVPSMAQVGVRGACVECGNAQNECECEK